GHPLQRMHAGPGVQDATPGLACLPGMDTTKDGRSRHAEWEVVHRPGRIVQRPDISGGALPRALRQGRCRKRSPASGQRTWIGMMMGLALAVPAAHLLTHKPCLSSISPPTVL